MKSENIFPHTRPWFTLEEEEGGGPFLPLAPCTTASPPQSVESSRRIPSVWEQRPRPESPMRSAAVLTRIMSDLFSCRNCNESLCGQKYIEVEEKPHCIRCYERLYANTCQECKEIIGHDEKELMHEDRFFHENCFRCFSCDRSLADESFTLQGGALLCSDCYCSHFSSKCAACNQSVMPGSRMLEYQGSAWHEDCFLCHGCEKPIGGEAFVPDDGDFYCVPCYEQRVAPRCSYCRKASETGSTSPSRTASGTSRASNAPAAPCRWWAPGSSPTGTTSCAETATATTEDGRGTYEHLLGVTRTVSAPASSSLTESITLFKFGTNH
ncbi:four and a half LIM domains protein 3-like isoform 2-T2 [Anableps anableps]